MNSQKTRRICMDYSAGKPVDPRVIEEMLSYMNSSFGNPSSLHTLGQDSKKALAKSREAVAKLVNAEDPETIIFNSGSTESNNLAAND
jgi:cysteine desulfurase